MATNYKNLINQARQEGSNVDNPTSSQSGNHEKLQTSLHANIQADNEEKLANLCVRVPESWRNHWKAEAAKRGIPLADYVITALKTQYGLPEQ